MPSRAPVKPATTKKISIKAKSFTVKTRPGSYTVTNRFGRHTYQPNKTYPLLSLQQGNASFYEHGKRTACGNLFDKNQMTAAHPTAKIPCIAKIRRLDDRKCIYVIINDRGPFYPGRVCDLSLASAKALGFIKQGVTKVSIKVLPIQSKILCAYWYKFRNKRLPDKLFTKLNNPLGLKRYLDRV